MVETGEELGPAAAYSALVAEWLNQAYHAQMIQVLDLLCTNDPGTRPIMHI